MAKLLTTEQAFDQLINRADLWRKTGLKMQDRLNYKDKVRTGVNITINKKQEILAKAGYLVQQVTTWNEPQ